MQQTVKTLWQRAVCHFGGTAALVRAFLLGYGLCLSFVAGAFLSERLTWPASRPLAVALAALPGAALAWCYPLFLRACGRLLAGKGYARRAGEGRFYARCTAALFAAWLPVYLAYWPGIYSYDIPTQMLQVTGGYYSTHHPLLHTLLLQAFYRLGGALGSVTLGMALHVLLQMAVFAAAIAYLLLFLRRMGLRPAVLGAFTAYFAILPVFSVLGISMTKDILFSAAFLAAFVCLCTATVCPGQWGAGQAALFTAAGTAACLLRNNGIFALAAACAAAAVCLRGAVRRRVVLSAVLAAVLAVGGGRALAGVLHAQSGSANELLSVPYQQLATVYFEDQATLQPQEKAALQQLMPELADYDPYLADAAKQDARAAEDWAGFFSLYGRLLARYPADCVKAFLRLTQGYWYLDDTTHARIYGEGLDTRLGYLMTDHYPKYGVEHHSLFPALEALYEELFSANRYQDIPLVRYLFSPALYVWLLVLCVCGTRRARGVPLALLAGLMLTLLAGPCVLIRYALPYILCLPGLYALAFRQEEEK